VLEVLGKVCTILWVPEFLTSQKCVRCEAVGHDKEADHVSFDFDKHWHRLGTCPRCGCQQDRDVNAALNQADRGRDATQRAHLDAD
jgi:transposase